MELLEMMPIRIKITAILRRAIYSGEYKSGDELSLTDIAGKLGISRTPVREAFQVLESEGLITLRMNRGAIVNTIDRKFIRDIFETRILLESEAAALAAENGMETDALLQRLKELQAHMDRNSKAEYEALNRDIHLSIWNAADNHQIKRYLLEMWNGPSVGAGPDAEMDHYKKSTEEHIAILCAIRDHAAAEAKQAMDQHIRRSMENMLTHY